MIKSGYREGLYYRDNFHIGTDEVEQQIRLLLSENHGVGIIGGYYEPGYPFCMVSELTVNMLGYDSAEEFETATGNCMAGLLMDKEYLNHKSAVPSEAYELYLKGKYNNLWVRIVSRDVTVSTGEKLWIASVCDMDALFKKDMQVTRIMRDSERRELTHKKELKQANNELERQKQALERALKDAELNNAAVKSDSCVDEPISLNGVRILLAEDNELNMEIERFFTEQNGAIVTPAVNGREAVDIFSASEPGYFDLILMDVMMPKMNGYEATKAIRGLNRSDAASVPIIAMSANAFVDDIKKSKSVGMNDHLPKPISTEKLLSTIKKYI